MCKCYMLPRPNWGGGGQVPIMPYLIPTNPLYRATGCWSSYTIHIVCCLADLATTTSSSEKAAIIIIICLLVSLCVLISAAEYD